MIYTKEEFKQKYDNNEYLDLKDIWDCAKFWGLYLFPRQHSIFEVIRKVLETCNIKTI